MKRIAGAVIIIAISSSALWGQNEVDALRYSQTGISGSARFVGMGGAFGAVGADFTSLSYNPAGLGLYRKSEFTFSPSFYGGKTSSSYFGTNDSDSKQNFNVGNVGMVFTQEYPDRDKGLKIMQFGMGLNRLNNFNNRMQIQGFNTQNSLTDTWVYHANGIPFTEIENDYDGYYAYDLNLAWYTYLIDTINGYNDRYFGASEGGRVLQTKYLTSWGSMNEFVFSMGANFSERFFIGATLGLPYVRYFEESTYSETDTEGVHDGFTQFNLYNELKTVGSGINIKFGAILRATDWLRVGGAFHSPTWYGRLTDTWSSSLENTGVDRASSPIGTYDYRLETPYKAIGSLAFILAKYGMISIDYEYIDYAEAHLRGNDYNFMYENNAITNIYRDASNIRIGGELRLDSYLIRGGYSVYGTPFKQGINDGEVVSYSAGFGYREAHFFIDFAFVHSVSDEDYYLYSTPDISYSPVKNTLRSNNFILTLGFRY
ncbi:MAG: hypothetical protein JXA03_02125 [Bacteroidales bacterium]|nr:hypothetical protein [Bacteroidales bacterium]